MEEHGFRQIEKCFPWKSNVGCVQLHAFLFYCQCHLVMLNWTFVGIVSLFDLTCLSAKCAEIPVCVKPYLDAKNNIASRSVVDNFIIEELQIH